MGKILKRVLCPILPAAGTSVELPEQESNHVVRVLRLKSGDQVEALDGHGNSLIGLLRIAGKKAWLENPIGTDHQVRKQPEEETILPLVLEVAIIKADPMVWMIEKAVELGVRELVPLITDHCVVKVEGKGPAEFQERWQKIADQSLKQCGRLKRMEVLPPVQFKEWLQKCPNSAKDRRYWCDKDDRLKVPDLLEELSKIPAAELRNEVVRLMIGPEGGWSEGEIEMLRAFSRSVSLGPLILRAETAGTAALSIASAWIRLARAPLDKSLDPKRN
ncbi:16S rRNA (uracil(1498)-N(3))-methyltransferase [bacterium]|jgi:16S rRNA (uracil1498-N3)-methyltransferase|nr:16S rRNA (uracil(1498)-N(3))-methyltransferase [bacterium]